MSGFLIGLIAFATGLLLRPLLWRQQKPDEGKWQWPPVEPKEKPVKIHDADTHDDYDFYEGASKGDDPTQAGEKGKKGQYGVLVKSNDVLVLVDVDLLKEKWAAGQNAGLDAIECGYTYRVLRWDTKVGSDANCGGAAAMKAEFESVKAAVLAEAIKVADRCKRKPSCQADIVFQALSRKCWQAPEHGKWVLSTYYEVLVVCYTL